MTYLNRSFFGLVVCILASSTSLVKSGPNNFVESSLKLSISLSSQCQGLFRWNFVYSSILEYIREIKTIPLPIMLNTIQSLEEETTKQNPFHYVYDELFAVIVFSLIILYALRDRTDRVDWSKREMGLTLPSVSVAIMLDVYFIALESFRFPFFTVIIGWLYGVFLAIGVSREVVDEAQNEEGISLR